MKIIVLGKQVPNTTEVKLDPKTGNLIREGVESIINPDDRHALEAAVRLREDQGGKITVLSMGPGQAIDGDTAQIGPQVADYLGIPQVTYVFEIESITSDKVTVKRQLEDGYER